MFDEEKIDVEFVKEFIQEMLDNKQNFTSKNPKIAQILKSMPVKLQAYLKELQALEKEKNLDDEVGKDQKKLSEKRQKIQDRIEKIAKEIFIISCASNNSLEKSLQFHEKCGLDKDFSKFGECGLSPLMAAMLSGKSLQDLQTLINLGANINEKNAYGFTVLDFAEMVGIAKEITEFLKERGATSINSDQQKEEGLQRQKNREEKLEGDLEKSQKQDLEKEKIQQQEEAQRERFEQEQIMIAQSMLALELYEELIEARKQVTISAKESSENIEREKISRQNEVSINPESGDEARFTKDAEQKVRENKTATELEIEKILNVDLAEININELLFSSVKNGQSMLAILLVHCGADVNYRQGDKSVLDMAIEKGNGSLIAALSALSAPEIVSNAFLKVVNNGNYTAQTLSALVGERAEYKKENSLKCEVVANDRSEISQKQKDISHKETRLDKATNDLEKSSQNRPSAQVRPTKTINVKDGKEVKNREGGEKNVDKIDNRRTSQRGAHR